MNESGGGKRDAVDVIEIHLICNPGSKAPIGYAHLWIVNCPAHAYGRVINNIWLRAWFSPSPFFSLFKLSSYCITHLPCHLTSLTTLCTLPSYFFFLKKSILNIFRWQKWNKKVETCGYMLHLQSTFAAKRIKIAPDKNHEAEEYVI